MVLTAASNSGSTVSKVQLFECGRGGETVPKGGKVPPGQFGCPPGTEPPDLLAEADGDRNHPQNSLTLQYTFAIQKGEQRRLVVVAEDTSGKRWQKGHALVGATEVPTDVFPAAGCPRGISGCPPEQGGVISLTGVLIATPSYNPSDPDFHYFFVPDSDFAEIANTLGSDRVAQHDVGLTTSGGEVHPEQDGWVVDMNQAGPGLNDSDRKKWQDAASKLGQSGIVIPAPRGWVVEIFQGRASPGVVWPWDPSMDVWGNTLTGCYTASDTDCHGQRSGDHILITGRLRYDHEPDLKPCWDVGSTAVAYEQRTKNQGHSMGHAEIHPVNFIAKLPPLVSSAQTVVWQSICQSDAADAFILATLDKTLRPMAPYPDGFAVDVQEFVDSPFTDFNRVLCRTLSPDPDRRTVHLHVEVKPGGRFRAKYTLQWLRPDQAHVPIGPFSVTCPQSPPPTCSGPYLKCCGDRDNEGNCIGQCIDSRKEQCQ